MALGNQSPYTEFGKRLMGLRKKSGMTRQQLGEMCGIAPSTIVNYEKGSRIPYADTAVKMAQTFGITVEGLLGVEAPKKTEVIDYSGCLLGKHPEDSAWVYLEGTNALITSDALSVEDQLDFIAAMHEILSKAEIRIKQKLTSNKFNLPEQSGNSKVTMREYYGDSSCEDKG